MAEIITNTTQIKALIDKIVEQKELGNEFKDEWLRGYIDRWFMVDKCKNKVIKNEAIFDSKKIQ